MKRLVTMVLVLVLVAVASVAQAADKPDPTGTWKWTVQMGDQSREVTLKLKLEGEKLTGAMVGRNDRETPIQEAKYKDGEVSFKVVREREGRKMTTTYTGKVSGDTIKGKVEFQGRDQARTRDWEAKRVKEEEKKEVK